MSWVAHDMEPYAVERHWRLKVAFVPLLIGSDSLDLMTKWYVYGIHLGPWKLKATDPAQFHRGWPGVRLHPLADLRSRDRADPLEGLREPDLGVSVL